MPRPKPNPGELHTVDHDFRPPGLPDITVATKRWCLEALDRMIASLQFRLDDMFVEMADTPGVVKWLRQKRRQWRAAIAHYKWMRGEVDRMTCKEHRGIEVTD